MMTSNTIFGEHYVEKYFVVIMQERKVHGTATH